MFIYSRNQHNIINQPQIYISPLSLATPPNYHSIPPLCFVTEIWFECSDSYIKSPPTIYFTYNSVYVPVLLSPFSPPSPPPAHVHKSVLYVYVTPLLPHKWVHQYNLSKFHIDAFIYDICFSVSDSPHFVYLWLIYVHIQQKPTQYYKSVILQLKNNKISKIITIYSSSLSFQ